MTVAPEVQALLDQRAIRDVVLRYCRGIDRLDLELVRDCYHPDATDDHGGFVGTRDEYVEWVGGVLMRYTGTMHVVANQLVELAGDHARSETYGVAYHHGDPPTDPRCNFTTGFRYVDSLVREDGAWRIAERFAVREWTHSNAGRRRTPTTPGPLGRRDGDDPVFKLLADLTGRP